jgi:hypothetical protein
MAALSHSRGHHIYWDNKSQRWRYSDNNEPDDGMRPCRHCGIIPTPDGYDPCLGFIANAKQACCGHGVGKGYVLY